MFLSWIQRKGYLVSFDAEVSGNQKDYFSVTTVVLKDEVVVVEVEAVNGEVTEQYMTLDPAVRLYSEAQGRINLLQDSSSAFLKESHLL